MIGGHFWREPPQENESLTVIGLFRERNVCRFEAAKWRRGALRDFAPSGCEGDYLFVNAHTSLLIRWHCPSVNARLIASIFLDGHI